MTPADAYRIKAGDLVALARAEPDPFQRAEYERLSAFYLRLGERAERDSQTGVVYETPPAPADQPQAQQQQQAQPEKKICRSGTNLRYQRSSNAFTQGSTVTNPATAAPRSPPIIAVAGIFFARDDATW